jgi:predicted kinase
VPREIRHYEVVTSEPFLLQMAGSTGCGKSTIAAAVGSATGAVVLDHDTTKSAIMAAGVPHPPAGVASYEVLFDLARDILSQGHSVVIDSPSVYAIIPTRGMALATALVAEYYFVECLCPEDVADPRVEFRHARPSQLSSAMRAAEVRESPQRHPHRPSDGTFIVDTTQPLDECVASVLRYLTSPGASGAAVPAPPS